MTSRRRKSLLTVRQLRLGMAVVGGGTIKRIDIASDGSAYVQCTWDAGWPLDRGEKLEVYDD